MSESNGHPGLAAALAAFQAEAPTFIKNKTANVRMKAGGTYSYKYADLGDILPIVNPLLARHGLSWSSKPARIESEMVLHFTLRHIGGETDEGDVPLGLGSNYGPQDLGSALSYMRRYAMTAQLNLATDEDDDGRVSQAAQQPDDQPPQPTARAAEQTTRPASAKQRGMIFGKAADKGMSSGALANVILSRTGNEPREWESQENAHSWLNRAVDRLPASAIDAILEDIEAAEVASADD